MPDDNDKPKRSEPTSSELEKLLEIELMQKRAQWQQAKRRRGGLLALSILFLLVVIGGALAGYFLFLSPDRVSQLKSNAAEHSQPDPSPSP